MDNEKLIIDNEIRKSRREKLSAAKYLLSANQSCPACGTAAVRDSAKFCRVCGKLLREEYQPLDTFRASYLLQKRNFQAAKNEPDAKLFSENNNSASLTASAFVVYSLVPYLGILFCPGAFLIGGIGAFNAYRRPHSGGGRTSIYSIVLSVIIFTVQIFLWWLLYYVPELGRRI
ncbi:MAG: hypothetical protein M3T96_03375 [Acidobacteriota bacterium]|nr:hypothetical protein [Acidobacteriota bacterium]